MEPEKTIEQVKPIKIFGALILLNLFLATIVVIFPEGKISFGKDFSLNFVPLKKIYQLDTLKKVDALKVIANIQTVDTNLVTLDSKALERIKREKISVPEEKQIQYPDNTRNVMASFFKSLMELENNTSLARIIHYGDSQLEGDRISDYLRNRLQLRFGGWGPGIVLPIDVSNSRISVRQSESNNWTKYAIYGKTQKLATGFYGIGASSYRFNGGANIKTESGSERIEIVKNFAKKKIDNEDGTFSYQTDSTTYTYDTIKIPKKVTINASGNGAWLKFLNAIGSYPRVRQYNKLTLLYSADEPFNFNLKVNEGQEINEILPNSGPTVKSFDLGEVTTGVNLNFSGKSPILYGIAFDGNTGIAVDNFPMRGSSALGFESINTKMLADLYRQMNVKLIILQYGINLVPDPKTNYDWYSKLFAKQLAKIKEAAPNVSILVVGPSDMSRKTIDGYESYPNIPLIRDAMKKAAFDNGCAFWDLYTAMGGQNSMSSWVSNNLAAKDFTHFSTSGARYVSEMLYNTLMEEYIMYLKDIGAM